VASSHEHRNEPSDSTNGENFSTFQVTTGFLGTALPGIRYELLIVGCRVRAVGEVPTLRSGDMVFKSQQGQEIFYSPKCPNGLWEPPGRLFNGY
jgi:hypothetical protein